MNENGVMISIKEIYDMLLETQKTTQTILSELSSINKKLETIPIADERSREALNKAEDAFTLAEKLEGRMMWVVGVIIAEMVAGAIGALFYFVQKGIGG